MRFIAGVDEAGRGPLAGPVVAAVVMLKPGQQLEGVRDSKKLSAKRRNELYGLIKEQSVEWSIGLATVSEIDDLNILGGTMLAMRRALEGLRHKPDLIRIDGNRAPDLPDELACLTETLIGGDDLCPAIGAASILAKVERDQLMVTLHKRYPEYGFDQHKGYPTKVHRQALLKYGITPEHRMSFRPVKDAASSLSAGQTHHEGG